MKILIIFALIINSCYANNIIHLKNLQHGCNYSQRATIDDPSVLWNFNIMNPHENLSLEDMSGEVWRDALGFEGHYKISNLCRLKSLSRDVARKNNTFHTIKDCIRKQNIGTYGYWQVSLQKNGKVTNIKVHQLLIKTFRGKQNLHI